MSADTEAPPLAPRPVTEELRRALGLLPGWAFTYLPACVEAECGLCGRSAMFVATAPGRPLAFCLRHARDF